MPLSLVDILLWLFVIDLGIVFGAGLYEARISVPRWMGAHLSQGPSWQAQEAQRDDVGRRFWGFTTTVPLTLLTVANLWAAWGANGPLRVWWLTASIAALVERVMTFGYFIPRMVALLKAADAPEIWRQATQWARLNGIRLLAGLVAWIASLQTLILSRGGR